MRIDQSDREQAGSAPRWLWPLVAGLAVATAVAGGGAWWWLNSRPVQVQVTAALPTDGTSGAAAAAVLQATGYLVARRQATVSTQITGTLTELYFDAGDAVKKGQLLARLEDGALRAALDVARANARSAEAQVEQARVQWQQSQTDARRLAELAAREMVSRQAAEQADSNAAVNGATLQARQRAADAARAQLVQAQVNYDYTSVRAPFAGVITAKAAQVGEIVSPLSAGGGFTRTGVGTIVDMESLEIEVDVNESSIGQIRPEMRCEAVLDAYPDWKVPAHVVAIIPAADRGKATVKVRVALEQKDARMVPDMGVRVAFLRAAPPAAAAQAGGVLVPARAVLQREGDNFVFVLADGQLRLRKVRLAAAEGGALRRVSEGLQPGERVVLSPAQSLQDGAAAVASAATGEAH